MISVIDIIEDTMVDGPGIRTSIYCAGCDHHCHGCHNPQSWDFNAGKLLTTDEIMSVANKNTVGGVTFSGGDPLYQVDGFLELAKKIKLTTSKDIWCYTGFTIEGVLGDDRIKTLLQYIDVLVDGPFIESLKDIDLIFRGSSNQRLIDVPETLKYNRVVLFDPNKGWL